MLTFGTFHNHASLASGLVRVRPISLGQPNLSGPFNMVGLETARPMVERPAERDDDSLDPEIEEEIDRFVMDSPKINPTEATLVLSSLYGIDSIF